ncbi:hypothetical protein OY671_012505, partial [Metschnikowia pulcherrima]
MIHPAHSNSLTRPVHHEHTPRTWTLKPLVCATSSAMASSACSSSGGKTGSAPAATNGAAAPGLQHLNTPAVAASGVTGPIGAASMPPGPSSTPSSAPAQ